MRKNHLAVSFALVLAAGSATAVVAHAQPKPAVTITDEAKKHFKAGVDFLNDPDGARYEEAYREFKKAYSISPSWKILGNLSLTAMKLERVGEAIEGYEKYLAEGGTEVHGAEKTQIERDSRLMKTASSTVTLTGVATEVTVVDQRQKANGAMAVNTYAIPPGKSLTVIMQAGRHVMTAKVAGKEEKWEVELAAGQTTTHAFKGDASAAAAPVPPPTSSAAKPAEPAPSSTAALDTSKPPPSSTLKTAGIVGIGVGGAMILGGVVTGLIGKGKLSTLESDCPDKRCTSDKQSDADSIKSYQTMTNVLWIGGALVAGAGAAMFVIGNKQQSEAAAREVRVLPVATQGGGGLFATGRF